MEDSTTCQGRNGKFLKVAKTEKEAREFAAYVKQRYGNEQVPYYCKNCGGWHLSPKERQTPGSYGCGCCDESGNAKVLYNTKESAEKRAKILLKEQGKKLYIYRCPTLSGWHLTHKKY